MFLCIFCYIFYVSKACFSFRADCKSRLREWAKFRNHFDRRCGKQPITIWIPFSTYAPTNVRNMAFGLIALRDKDVMLGARLSVPIGNQQEYYHAVRRSSFIKVPENAPSDLHSDLRVYLHPIRHPTENSADPLAGEIPLRDYEPGFDLTEEEIAKFKLWDRGVIPYYIDVPSFSDKVLRDRIRWFLNMVNAVTSLNFIELARPPGDEETRWVFFVNRRGQLGCADHSVLNLTTHGVQRVLLGYDCMATGGELAETVMSVAGVPPQHNAPNRDKYIKVVEENIEPDKRYLFKKLKNSEWLFHDVNYDFMSASHYHHHRHSINGRATIITKKRNQGIHVAKRGFSSKDILKLKMLYNFVVMKKKSKSKVSACNKLFSRGKKFKNNKREPRKQIPRPKPKKYLAGKDDDDDDEPSGEIESIEYLIPSIAIKVKNETKNEKQNVSNNNKNTQGFRSHAEDKFDIKTERSPNQPSFMMKYYYKDPLTYLSDYETGDENFQRSILKKREFHGFGKMAEIWKTKNN